MDFNFLNRFKKKEISPFESGGVKYSFSIVSNKLKIIYTIKKLPKNLLLKALLEANLTSQINENNLVESFSAPSTAFPIVSKLFDGENKKLFKKLEKEQGKKINYYIGCTSCNFIKINESDFFVEIVFEGEVLE